MVAILPLIVAAGVMGCVFLVAYAASGNFAKFQKTLTEGVEREIRKADLPIAPAKFALGLIFAGACLWLLGIAALRQTVSVSLLLFPAAQALVIVCGIGYVRFRGSMRLKKFGDQLELVMRTLSGALRVGVSFRQALVLVTEEIPNPAKREFRRVIGRTNIGVPLVDAIEEMAKTNPGGDLMLFLRCIRVQQQTGGDLASVLDTLAATIRDRRRVRRKMGALTSQGRLGAFIIGGLPIFVGMFVIGTQGDMRDALLHTTPGLACLGGVAVLEALAAFSLNKILQLDV
ncbi:MAG: type II secretion system F family protein [Candidatus Eremiobacteraeota bacterium]|nr:type II secretion system F family protein [Candidatus Eremiobacteraeota bacterium]